jgi:Uncharacterized conserved protein, contains double-stranded beta-helix domain
MKLSLSAAVLAFALTNAASLSAADQASAPLPLLGSTIYPWDEMVVKPTGVGARRDINDGPTATLARFECHISTLQPGLPSHPPHQHAQEELIIIKEGTLDVHINGQEHRLGPGGVFWFSSNDWHAVRNVGEGPATYLVFNFATDATRAAPKTPAAESAALDKLRSGVWAWENVKVQRTPKGERREFFKSPTVTCQSFSIHATTLRGREMSHAPHRHPDEEIIIVKEGTVEATVNGRSKKVGPGSILFFASNDEHGLRNVGDTPATYYVMRVVTEKTPAAN